MADKVVGILGATGVVGRQMLQCLEERDFPVARLVPLASARSAGKKIAFRGEDVEIVEAVPDAFEGIDILLGAADDATAKRLLPEAVKRGAVCVDNSHAFRLDDDVPLVIPEINAEDVKWHNGIISNPNCATIIGLVPLWPLHKVAGLTRIIASTYQAASGAGMPGLNELEREMALVAKGEPVGETAPFAYQLAANLIPQIGGFKDELYTSEEIKMGNEGRKICHLPNLRVNCTCVRVPIMRSHSESITAEFERPITPDEARAALEAAPGVKVVDDPAAMRYPMPLETSDQDLVFVGRIRRDTSAPDGVNAITFFCCGDQIRKGAATNAVQIAELL
ncbi:MAG: aspartate-semialdehyde dehydrogenase [Atopobiaceae bacterium]|nr:aspartate-semialdehyde dehydrogenase [Atopobiaceae bacterium]